VKTLTIKMSNCHKMSEDKPNSSDEEGKRKLDKWAKRHSGPMFKKTILKGSKQAEIDRLAKKERKEKEKEAKKQKEKKLRVSFCKVSFKFSNG
jgi:hypothetical protein